jgi:hypothetical protein
LFEYWGFFVDAISESSVMPLGEVENESHAYVPYVYARDMIAKVMNDMKNMKGIHLRIVDDIGKNYKCIEDSTQVRPNHFLLGVKNNWFCIISTSSTLLC